MDARYSHTVDVDEAGLLLISLPAKAFLQASDVLCQLWVQVKLCGELTDPVPYGERGREERKREKERERERERGRKIGRASCRERV